MHRTVSVSHTLAPPAARPGRHATHRPSGLIFANPGLRKHHSDGGVRGWARHVARAGKITEVDQDELEVEVANRDRPLIIDFFATWCGPCVLLSKELETVAEQMGDKIRILKIDCDKNEQISSALQIQGLPTMVFVGMDPTKPALRTEGLLPAQAIVEIVETELLGVSAPEPQA